MINYQKKKKRQLGEVIDFVYAFHKFMYIYLSIMQDDLLYG